MRSASSALADSRLKLEEAESGRITPPAPSTIPMAEYYHQSEMDYEEAMVTRRQLEETCKRLEAITADRLSKSRQQQHQQQGHHPAEAGSHASGKRGNSPETGATRQLMPKKSVLLSPRGIQQARSGVALTTVDDAADFSATSPRSRGGGDFATSSNTGRGGSPPPFDAADGVESLGDALTKIDRIKAILATTKMTAPVNPYSTSVEAAEAEKRTRLRPHSWALLDPLTFDDAARPIQYDRELHAFNALLAAQQAEARAADAARARVLAAQAQRYHAALGEWRSLEGEQLATVHRHAVERTHSEQEHWALQNQRNKHIMDKVSDIHRKANLHEAAKLHERQSLALLSAQSAHRVAMECLMQQEQCIRRALETAENGLFEEEIRLPRTLLGASFVLSQRTLAGSPAMSPARFRLH